MDLAKNPSSLCFFELKPVLTSEDRLLGKIEFLMNILDVLLKHLNEYLSNIFILALCSVDDWLL